MSKPVLEDRPIWPVAPAEDLPREAAQTDPSTNQAPSEDGAAPQGSMTADSFEGFGSFSG